MHDIFTRLYIIIYIYLIKLEQTIIQTLAVVQSMHEQLHFQNDKSHGLKIVLN